MNERAKRTDANPHAIPAQLLGTADVLAALRLVRVGQPHHLTVVGGPGCPGSLHPPFQIIGYRTPRGLRNQGDQAWLGANEVNLGWNTELLLATVHTGTHIDALSHITCGPDDHWFRAGSVLPEDGGYFVIFTYHATTIPPIISRGVMLDIAGERGVAALDAGAPIRSTDLERALAAEHVVLQQGDVALIRTGYLGSWPTLPERETQGGWHYARCGRIPD